MKRNSELDIESKVKRMHEDAESRSSDIQSHEDDDVLSDASSEPKRSSSEIKVFSNKKLDLSAIPVKPVQSSKKPAKSKQAEIVLTFTNSSVLKRFMEPIIHSVKKIRFFICKNQVLKDNTGVEQFFTGFRTECHDQAFTLADRGMFECDIETTLADEVINQMDFCVTSDAFMESLIASTLKETCLSISKYADQPDKISFESINNENDVRTVYNCNLVDSSQVDSLDGFCIELGFHINVRKSALEGLSLSAKRCGASSLSFDLWQSIDPNDPLITHSKMSVGFEGINTSGSHDFFISTRKIISNDGQAKWVPLTTSVGLEHIETLVLEKRSSNSYDNKKLRLFLNHMDCAWVLVHLAIDNSTQPLVLECLLGGQKTKHTVIVAPKESSI